MTFPSPPLRVTNSGEERCRSGHSFGPAVRDHYLMHVVITGKGVLHNAYGQHAVRAGELFLIEPGETTFYQADADEPWHYVWVGLSGGGVDAMLHAFGLSSRTPTLALGERHAQVVRTLRRLYADATSLRMGELAAAGDAYRLLALLGECAKVEGVGLSQAERYYLKALWLIESAEPMSVQALADAMGLSRSQLFRVFKQACGKPPQEAIRRHRLEQAKRLLTQTDLPLEEIATASGYQSAARLCDAFRESGLATPTAYRRSGGRA